MTKYYSFFKDIFKKNKTIFWCALISLLSFQAEAKWLNPVAVRVPDSNAPLCTSLPCSFTVTGTTDNTAYDRQVIDLLTFYVDQSSMLFSAKSKHYKIYFTYTLSDQNGGKIPNYIGISDQLEIYYNPFNHTEEYADKNSLILHDGYSIEVIIDSIEEWETGQLIPTPLTTFPTNVYLETEVRIERFYDITPIQPFNTNIATNADDGIEISWTGDVQFEEYQLEWAFLDDIKFSPDNSSSPNTSFSSITFTNYASNSSALQYDFKNNASRVTLTGNSYVVSPLYDHGYLIFRVRGVGRYVPTGNPPGFIDEPVYGSWCPAIDDIGTLATLPSTSMSPFPYPLAIHEKEKNWQYSGTFAEEGKKKEVMTYGDGSLRGRETVTKNNTDNNVIVGQQIYDYAGRPAVNILPTPVVPNSVSNKIKYYNQFNTGIYNNGSAHTSEYNYLHFDPDNTGDVCNSSIQAMENSSGSSQYYSGNNPDQNDANAYIPDAEGFPFTQTEYLPDNTGRVRKQSGVGPTLKIDPVIHHETTYMYSSANQVELDRLFGSEAGDASHYQKNVVLDANGQASISYLNQEGKVVATCLAGDPPSNLEGIPSSTAVPETLSVDLFKKDLAGNSSVNIKYNSSDEPEIDFSSKIAIAYETDYTLDYSITFPPVTDECLLSSVCFDCVYDLEIAVRDECGQIVDQASTSTHLGKFTEVNNVLEFNTDCNYNYSAMPLTESFQIHFTPGVYTISKILKVNKAARDFYVDAYLDPANMDGSNTNCWATLEELQNQYLLDVDLTSCHILCTECVASLGSREDFVANQQGTEFDYDKLVEACMAPCKEENYCEIVYTMMLEDVSRGGQYGKYLNSNGQIDPVDPLSVFNENNKLLANANQYGGYPHTGNWRHPLIKLNGNVYTSYLNDDNSPSKIYLTPVTGGGYSPPITDILYAYTDNDGIYTFPEHLLNFNDFITTYWQNSWKKSLVMYHPEYMYYMDCISYNDKQVGNAYSSDDYDKELLMNKLFSNAVSPPDGTPALIDAANSSFTSIPQRIFFADPNNPDHDPFLDATYDTHVLQADNTPLDNYWGQELRTKFLNYVTIGGVDLSMPEFAAYVTRCGTQYGNTLSTGCTNFGTDFTGVPATNTNIRNKEWTMLVDLYISEKMKLRKKRADVLATHNCCSPPNTTCSTPDNIRWQYTGCIGAKGNAWIYRFLELYPVLAAPYGYYYNNSPYYSNNCQLCYDNDVAWYKSKQKRFASVEEVVEPGDANSTAYQLYLQTGLCPLAYQFSYFLNGLISKNVFTSLTAYSLQNMQEFTVDLYNAVYADGPSNPFTPLSWQVTSATTASILTASIFNTSAGINCDFTFDGMGNITNWQDVVSFSDFETNGTNGSGAYIFTAKAHLIGGGSPVDVTGTTCIQLEGCTFDFQCDANAFAIDLQALMTVLAHYSTSNNPDLLATSSTPVDLLNNTYGPLITPNILNALQVQTTNDLKWDYSALNSTFTIHDNLNLKNLVINFAPVGSFSLSDIKVFDHIVSDHQNFFLVDVYDNNGSTALYTPGTLLGQLKGKITLSDSQGNVSEVPVGECEYPAPLRCSQQEHLVRKDLEDLLKDVLTGQEITSNSNFNLFYSFDFTTLLQSYLLAPLTFTTSTLQISHVSGTVDHINLEFDFLNSCNLTLESDITPGTSIKILHLENLKGTGTADSYGNYYTFTIDATFEIDGVSYTGTINGSSCFPLKNCDDCPETELRPGFAERITLLESDGLERGIILKDESAYYYKKYTDALDEYNSKNSFTSGDPEFASAMTFEDFVSKGYAFSMTSFLKFIASFNTDRDDARMVVDPESFVSVYQNKTNSFAEYDRYLAAVASYNVRAIMASVDTIIPEPDTVFFLRSHADINGDYLNYIDTVAPTDTVPDPEGFRAIFSTIVGPGVDPVNDDDYPCAEAYRDYVEAFIRYKDYVATHSYICPGFNPTYNIMFTYSDFIRNNLCCEPDGVSFIVQMIYVLNQLNSCPLTLADFRNCDEPGTGNEECQSLYLDFLLTLADYNQSAYASYNMHSLDPGIYPTYNLFVQSGLCECVRDYIGYLNSDYIDITSSSYSLTNSLPVPINLYTGCGAVVIDPPDDDGDDKCADKYGIYMDFVNRYNDYITSTYTDPLIVQALSITNIYTLQEFVDQQLCDCIDFYTHYLESVIDGTTTIPVPMDRTDNPEFAEFVFMVNFGINCSEFEDEPCISNIEIPEPVVITTPDPCEEQLINIAMQNALNAFQSQQASMITHISDVYNSTCLSAVEDLIAGYQDKEYHYTLYYYDQAGNLIKTIPPEGVERLEITDYDQPLELQAMADRANNTHTLFTNHRLASQYQYTSLNQILRQGMPDQDKLDLWDYYLSAGLPKDLMVTAVQFTDEANGYLSGYMEVQPSSTRGYLFVTHNAGRTWQKVNDLLGSNLKKAVMISNTRGVAVGSDGILIETQDGGLTWDLVDVYGQVAKVGNLNDICMDSNGDLLAVGNDGFTLPIVVGPTLTCNTPTGNSAYDLLSLTYNLVDNKYYAAGKTTSSPEGVIYRLDVGGWSQIKDFNGLDLGAVSYYATGSAFAGGVNGFLLQTITSGVEWKIIKNNLGVGYDFKQLYFANGDRGTALILNTTSGYNELYYTMDGGKTWVLFDNTLHYTSFAFTKTSGMDIRQGLITSVNGSGVTLQERLVLTTNTVITAACIGKMIIKNPPSAPVNTVNYTFDFKSAAITTDDMLGKVYILRTGIRTDQVTTNQDIVAYLTEIFLTPPPVGTPPQWTFSDAIDPFAGTISSPGNFNCAIDFEATGKVWGLFQYENNSSQTGDFFDYDFSSPSTPTITTFTPPEAIDKFTVKPTSGTFYGANFSSLKSYTFDATGTTSVSAPNTLTANIVDFDNDAAASSSDNIIAVGDDGLINYYINLSASAGDQSNFIHPDILNDIRYISDGVSTDFLMMCGNDGYLIAADLSSIPLTFKYHYLADNVEKEKLNAVTLNYDNGFEGVIVGDNSKAIKFTWNNGITSSELLNIPVQVNLTDIDNNGTEAYISGENGNLFYSDDVFPSSPTFTSVVTNTGRNFNSVAFIPSTITFNALAVGDQSGIYQLSGANAAKINSVFTPKIKKVHFANNLNGTIVGNNFTIRRTDDGGSTWKTVIQDPGNAFSTSTIPVLYSVFTKADGSALIVGTRSYIGKVDNATNISTSVSYSTSGDKYNDIGMVTDGGLGYIVGGNGNTGLYKVTTDGGDNWSNTNPANTPHLNALHVFPHDPANAMECFVTVGDDGFVGVYQDDLINSTHDFFQSTNFDAGFPENLSDVFFHKDLKTGYAVGDNGAIARCYIDNPDNIRTVNSGTSSKLEWTVKSSIDDFVMVNEYDVNIATIGFATQYDGFVGGSFNQGANNYINQPYARRLHDEPSHFSTRYWYDKLGRLVLSQNSKQYETGNYPKRYSYTLYDVLGRISEVGEKTDNPPGGSYLRMKDIFGSYIGTTYNSDAIDPVKLNLWLDETSGTRQQITHTFYDEAEASIASQLPAAFTQENTRNRVVCTTYEDEQSDNDPATYTSAFHYSYDVHGNVKSFLQDNGLFAGNAFVDHRFKRMDYQYDLISGKVNDVQYQHGEYDAFTYHYDYDADNRLTAAYSSSFAGAEWMNQMSDHLWDLDAKYFYYPHGPLERMELGDTKAQGVDYAYTLQGWLKGVNSDLLDPARDIGKDGETSGPNTIFAHDAFGYTLGYYNGDYLPIDQTNYWSTVTKRFEADASGSDLNAARNDLFNGNIGSMVTAISKPSSPPDAKPMGNAYQYDQLNRLISSQSFDNFDLVNNTWGTGGNTASELYTDYTYDGNGNILTLNRYDMFGTQFDELHYDYFNDNGHILSNRLYHYSDNISGSLHNDLDNTATSFDNTAVNVNTSNNYRYDPMGNLVHDEKQEIDNITWTLSGKIKRIERTSTSSELNHQFTYDPAGNRMLRDVWPNDRSYANSTYYVRDPQGNVMATYLIKVDIVAQTSEMKWQEQDLYGSSRLGMYKPNLEVLGLTGQPPLYDTKLLRTLDFKNYELTNHLGNVQEVVSPRKEPISSGGVNVDYYYPDAVNATDYYPFGMAMIDRDYNSKNYKFGFNGKENDNDVKGIGNQQDYGMRIYDTRLGKFLSIDPITKEYPDLTPYQFASNTPIWAIDIDGLEGFIATGINGYGMVLGAEDANKVSNSVVNWFSSKHQQGMRNVRLASYAREMAIKQGRANGDGINWYVKTLVYISPWWNSTATNSDANDGAVLMSGKNLDGSDATKVDYAAAGLGIFIPMLSGSSIEHFFKGFIKASEGYKYAGQSFKDAAEFEKALNKLGGRYEDAFAMATSVCRDVAQKNNWKKLGNLSKQTKREFYDLGNNTFGSIDIMHGHIEIFTQEGKTLKHQGSINIDGVKNKERNSDYDIKL